MADIEPKRVFVSYSWTIKDDVKHLVDCIIRDGVEVVVDFYDLKLGEDKYSFMERSVNDDTIDRVLIICDKTYADKANKRTGGVGDETVIITPKLYENKGTNRFIPIAFEKDSNGNAYIPTYIESRIYIDLSDDTTYESNYEQLLREIYQKPAFRRPVLGKMPEYLNDEVHDYSLLRGPMERIRSGNYRADNNYPDYVVTTMKQLVDGEISNCEEFIKAIECTKDQRDLIVDYCASLLSNGVDIEGLIIGILEKTKNDMDFISNDEYKHEVIEFFLWDLFISFVALLLYYEKLNTLHNILTHTFFIKKYGGACEPNNYSVFNCYLNVLEGECKPKSDNPRLFTLQGDIEVRREHDPILTKRNLTSADILLFQFYPMYYGDRKFWFPRTYVYHDGLIDFWAKLQSKKYCENIIKMTEVKDIDELKAKISKCPYDERMAYSNSFDAAPWITQSIDVGKIGQYR